jgi:hypothetical protein
VLPRGANVSLAGVGSHPRQVRSTQASTHVCALRSRTTASPVLQLLFEESLLGALFSGDDDDHGRELGEVRRKNRGELHRVERRTAFDGTEELERLIESAETSSQRQLVHGFAYDEHVDERFTARQIRDDTGDELDRGLEQIGIARARVEDDADAREIFLLVLADDGRARACPGAGVKIANRIASPVRSHAEEIGRFPRLRGKRDASGLVLRRDDERQAADVRDPRDDVDLHPVARQTWPTCETERRNDRGRERIEMVEATRDEARFHRRRGWHASTDRRLFEWRVGPRSVPREEGAADANGDGLRQRRLAFHRDGERDFVPDGHATGRSDAYGRIAESEETRCEEGTHEKPGEDREDEVGARPLNVGRNGAGQRRDHEERASFVRQRAPSPREGDLSSNASSPCPDEATALSRARVGLPTSPSHRAHVSCRLHASDGTCESAGTSSIEEEKLESRGVWPCECSGEMTAVRWLYPSPGSRVLHRKPGRRPFHTQHEVEKLRCGEVEAPGNRWPTWCLDDRQHQWDDPRVMA